LKLKDELTFTNFTRHVAS